MNRQVVVADMSSVRWRRYAAAAVIYIGLRLTVVLIAGPVASHGDTSWYLVHPVDILGRSPRPWIVALPMQAFGSWGFVVFQTVLSGMAFCVLAAAAALTLRDRRVQFGAFAVVLLLGASPRTTAWDAMVLSESMAISFTALLVAALLWIDRLAVWGFVSVFALWLLTREAHMYLAVMVVLGVSVWGWRQRRWTIPALLLGVSLWGWWTYNNDKWAEEYNVAANVALHVGNDPEMFLWFNNEGMPPSTAFYQLPYLPRFEALVVDPDFAQWVRNDGERVYAKYLATHPGFLVSEPTLALFTNNARNGWSLVDHQQDHGIRRTLGVPFWPIKATAYTDILILCALLSTLLAARWRMLDRRWVLPAALAASTWPHAMLVYHGAPWEVERHAAVLAFVLVLSCWWTVLLAVDVFAARSGHAAKSADDAVAERAAASVPTAR